MLAARSRMRFRPQWIFGRLEELRVDACAVVAERLRATSGEDVISTSSFLALEWRRS